jgi:hypothetical protein
MKAEKEIKAQLKLAEKELREVRQRFQRYDNIEDMHAIPVVEQEIETLKWVLSK